MFIKEGLAQGGVLIHCCKGESRSAAVAASYLMHKEKNSAAAAVLSLKEKRPVVNCIKFAAQLASLETALKIAPADAKTMESAGLVGQRFPSASLEEMFPKRHKGSSFVMFSPELVHTGV